MVLWASLDDERAFPSLAQPVRTAHRLVGSTLWSGYGWGAVYAVSKKVWEASLADLTFIPRRIKIKDGDGLIIRMVK